MGSLRGWLPVALAAALAACGKSRPGDLPNIRYGADICARCGMILSEERFAAGYVDEQGKSVVYDDVGEFLQAAAEQSAIVPVSFVHDAEDGRWLRASEAYFIRMPSLATPMGSGFAAFSSKEKAAAFGRRSGGAGKILGINEAALARPH